MANLKPKAMIKVIFEPALKRFLANRRKLKKATEYVSLNYSSCTGKMAFSSLSTAFKWSETSEGREYWLNLSTKYHAEQIINNKTNTNG